MLIIAHCLRREHFFGKAPFAGVSKIVFPLALGENSSRGRDKERLEKREKEGGESKRGKYGNTEDVKRWREKERKPLCALQFICERLCCLSKGLECSMWKGRCSKKVENFLRMI